MLQLEMIPGLTRTLEGRLVGYSLEVPIEHSISLVIVDTCMDIRLAPITRYIPDSQLMARYRLVIP